LPLDIKDAKSDEEKLEKFKEFWKKKDPAPKTEQNRVMREYYRRVAYANKHFKHYYDGWKTDMGMIYIVLGPPDNVDRHPFEYNSKPYEVWHFYNINQSFYFIDETGFGDYRLLNRNYGDWYRYRQ
jgi:GWxTD domain-containing protein